MALSVTAAKVSADQAVGSITRNLEAGEALTIGNAVYVTSTGTAKKAQSDGTQAEAMAIGIVVGGPGIYGETSIASGDRCTVCTFGPVYGFAGMTPGLDSGRVWIAATAGSVTQTKPAAGEAFAVGYAVEDDVLFVNPGLSDPSST